MILLKWKPTWIDGAAIEMIFESAQISIKWKCKITLHQVRAHLNAQLLARTTTYKIVRSWTDGARAHVKESSISAFQC